MNVNSDFYAIWRQFQGKEGEDNLPLCPIAEEFLGKIEETIFSPLGGRASRGQIAQAKYLLQEEWHAWKKSVPATHIRHALGHHRCLNDVYDACYDRLHLMELTLRPSPNLILIYDDVMAPPPPPPPPPPVNVAGIVIGELDNGYEIEEDADEEEPETE